jgi:hypothetical protein
MQGEQEKERNDVQKEVWRRGAASKTKKESILEGQ